MDWKNNSYQFRGELAEILQPKRISSQNGDFVIYKILVKESENSKLFIFEIVGEDRFNSFELKVGDKINIVFSLNCMSFNGSYFTTARVWKIYKQNQPSEKTNYSTTNKVESKQEKNDSINDVNDLPF